MVTVIRITIVATDVFIVFFMATLYHNELAKQPFFNLFSVEHNVPQNLCKSLSVNELRACAPSPVVTRSLSTTYVLLDGTSRGGRTLTPVRETDFKSAASTYSAMLAC